MTMLSKFANYWAQWYRKKSLAPMISYLQSVLKQYDDLEHSIEYKKPYNEKYHQECDTFSKMEMETEEKSYRLLFQYDKAQDEADKERRRQEQERYEEEHRYDDFDAVVHYDPSYKRDFPINTGTVIL